MKTILLLAIVVLAAGCVQQPSYQSNATPPLVNYTPPTGTPALQMIYPQNGDVIHSSAIGIRVNVTNFRLVSLAANLQNLQNEGHIDYILDNTMVQKVPYTTASFTQVPAGTHTLSVELRNNDDTSLSPPVAVALTVTVSP